MGTLSRIGVASDRELLRRFARFIREEGHQSRCGVFRGLIWERLAIVLLSCDHTRPLPENISDTPHTHQDAVSSSWSAHPLVLPQKASLYHGHGLQSTHSGLRTATGPKG
jgi:metal-responsive CopG/Arc/MetJ family transcriptional regulator